MKVNRTDVVSISTLKSSKLAKHVPADDYMSILLGALALLVLILVIIVITVIIRRRKGESYGCSILNFAIDGYFKNI